MLGRGKSPPETCICGLSVKRCSRVICASKISSGVVERKPPDPIVETHCYWCQRPLGPGEESCALRDIEYCRKRHEPLPTKEKRMTDANRSQQAAAAVSGASTEAVVEERGRTHGRYEDMAATQVRLLEALASGKNWETLPAGVKVFLLSTIQKMSRIVTGNPNEPDHYADIKGYAHLAHRTVTGEESVPGKKAEAPEPQAVPGTGKAMLSNGDTVRVGTSTSMVVRRHPGAFDQIMGAVSKIYEIVQDPTLGPDLKRCMIDTVADRLYAQMAELIDRAASQSDRDDEFGTNPMSLPELRFNLKRAGEIADFLIHRSKPGN